MGCTMVHARGPAAYIYRGVFLNQRSRVSNTVQTSWRPRKFEDMGAQMVREVASRTSDQAGDGTTMATVLAHAIVREGAKAVAAGMNPMDLKRGIDLAVESVVEHLKANSKKVTSNEEIAQVGTISANGDTEIGKFLAEAMKKVGNEGVITVEEAKSLETELDVVEGMQFDRGYISTYFVTNADKMRVELEDAYILINEKKLSGLQELLPLLVAVVQTGKPLVIVAEDVEGEALATPSSISLPMVDCLALSCRWDQRASFGTMSEIEKSNISNFYWN